MIEVKTELASIEETPRRHDVKVRLAAGVVAERFGWHAARLARLLVLPDGTTARAQVRRHDAVLRSALPLRGPALRAWLRSPSGSVSGLAFVPFAPGARGSRPAATRKRIRRPKPAETPGADHAPEAEQAVPDAEHAPHASSARASGSTRTEHAGGA